MIPNPLYLRLIAGGILIHCPAWTDHVSAYLGVCEGVAIQGEDAMMPCTFGDGGYCVVPIAPYLFCWDFQCGGSCDINLDGDNGTDQDIIDFFAALEVRGILSDFDGDGEPGTPNDVAVFFDCLACSRC